MKYCSTQGTKQVAMPPWCATAVAWSPALPFTSLAEEVPPPEPLQKRLSTASSTVMEQLKENTLLLAC